jgi:uncharacterized protein YcbK (DUF882 family)
MVAALPRYLQILMSGQIRAESKVVGYAEALGRMNELDRIVVGQSLPQPQPAIAGDEFARLLNQQMATPQPSMQAAGAAAFSPTQPASASMVRGDTAGLDPKLATALEQVARQIGKPIDVISGARTRDEQAELYRRFLNGTGNLAAKPGTSQHETGTAADVYVNGTALADVPGAREAAAAAGLGFPVPGEAWHVEPVGPSSMNKLTRST